MDSFLQIGVGLDDTAQWVSYSHMGRSLPASSSRTLSQPYTTFSDRTLPPNKNPEAVEHALKEWQTVASVDCGTLG